ncbi:hypothetical protein TNCV_3806911 [Trichonephila clavipes]|nr:hypothetical protein TNCV_3806911 [Trichonephila clavipes]
MSLLTVIAEWPCSRAPSRYCFCRIAGSRSGATKFPLMQVKSVKTQSSYVSMKFQGSGVNSLSSLDLDTKLRDPSPLQRCYTNKQTVNTQFLHTSFLFSSIKTSCRIHGAVLTKDKDV